MIKQPWWYPLARDPYGDSVTLDPEWWLKGEAMEVLKKAFHAPSDLPPQVPFSGTMDGARNAYEQMQNVSMVDQARNQGDKVKPYYGKPIPDAGTLLGYQAVDGVVITGPCGLRHFMRHAEARALASWLMKWSAEEPT